MTDQRSTDPLHGVTLESILASLVEKYGWEEMGKLIRIRCFTHDPSVGSSLKFLRKTPWARKKVEALYLGRNRGIRKKRNDPKVAEEGS
ncbi:MAG: DUF2132 domain-containing protein [Nitrospirae bacterium]|nr:DUF2132 domain-containing protein [Nitrospirota bacterium]